MFLHQKFSYRTIKHLEEVHQLLRDEQPDTIVYDTETTGLNFMVDRPFLIGIEFNKYIYITEPTDEFFEMLYNLPFDYSLVAHNAKYDYHMLANLGRMIPEHIKLEDTLTLARLTQYADDRESIGLEALGAKYVDEDSKFAGKVIKNHINELNKQRLKEVKAKLKAQKLPAKLMEIIDAYRNRVQFIEHPWDEWFSFIDENYKQPTYEDSYIENPNLMISYLKDDLVITREFYNIALPVVRKTGKNIDIYRQENDLIRIVAEMERTGLRVDINYLLESRERVLNHKLVNYDLLKQLTGIEFSVGQHKVIKDLFRDKFGLQLEKTDIKALEVLTKSKDAEVSEIAKLILELRTIDKWLSTYIEGKLNKVINGRIHTSINNAGTITGRVSSDLQQEPKEPLVDRDGNELFHPRRLVINDEGYKTYYFDYSQMELRVQAQYTVDVSGGDSNLCRAFIPFNCKSLFTGETYPLGSKDWDSGEWIDEHGNPWTPTDLHSVTTLEAFPELGSAEHPEFSHYRRLGKMCNFLKNYGGGIEAIKHQIIDNDEIAVKLNKGYYNAFPKILEYQKWVEDNLTQYGFVENLYGRRYYLKSSNYYYKAYNYIIQGGCADIVKEKEIQVYEFLKPYKSMMLLPIHDEIQIAIADGEEHLVPEIKRIMESVDDIMKDIPMVCDVEITHTSWADKEEL
jgi:DNA polymerase-1